MEENKAKTELEEETKAEGQSTEQPGEPAVVNTPENEEKAEQAEETEETAKGGPFRKKDKKKDKKDEMIEELNDRVKRQMAEFDNFRKRTEKEKAHMFESGAKSILEKILPVVDNFERGLAALPEGDKNSAFAEGIDKIYKQLLSTLEDMGVAPIEAEGKEFDPAFHNAVMHVEDEALGENVVAEELQKGYLYHGTVIRHSMVKVAN